jgi:HSP20 family molecular chaperone IbpA
MNRMQRYFENSQPSLSADAHLSPTFGSFGLGLSNPFAQLENILNAFYGAPQRQQTYGTQVIQIEGGIQIEIELPGFKPEQVTVETHQGILNIRADVEAKQEGNYQRQSIRRSYRLPEGTDVETITAELKNGILKVMVPYNEGGEAKKIPIN